MNCARLGHSQTCLKVQGVEKDRAHWKSRVKRSPFVTPFEQNFCTLHNFEVSRQIDPVRKFVVSYVYKPSLNAMIAIRNYKHKIVCIHLNGNIILLTFSSLPAWKLSKWQLSVHLVTKTLSSHCNEFQIITLARIIDLLTSFPRKMPRCDRQGSMVISYIIIVIEVSEQDIGDFSLFCRTFIFSVSRKMEILKNKPNNCANFFCHQVMMMSLKAIWPVLLTWNFWTKMWKKKKCRLNFL